MTTLIATEVLYFSRGDEDSFFAWLKRIGCVREVRGIGYELLIDVDEGSLSDGDLRELLALFHRYRVDMKQLRQLATDANAHWFRDDSEMYWHGAVFGSN
jgi:hypothetical protein